MHSDKKHDSGKQGKSYAQLAEEIKDLKCEVKKAHKKSWRNAKGSTTPAIPTRIPPDGVGPVVQGN